MWELAWIRSNSGGETYPVGLKKPNAWGIYDMSGNVYEWVEDCLHDNYQGAPTDGSAWLDEGGCKASYTHQGETVSYKGRDLFMRGKRYQGLRASRGGAWIGDPRYARSAMRDVSYPSYRSSSYGFRLVRIK